jgi:hypothetical protein
MTARIIPLQDRRPRPTRQVGPVAAALEHPAVLDGGDAGPLLAVQCFVRLRDITPAQRRLLHTLLRDPQGVTLTLAEGREG